MFIIYDNTEQLPEVYYGTGKDHWRPVRKDSLPRSADCVPVWIKLARSTFEELLVDLVYLSDNNEYWISTDGKRAYKIEEADYYTMLAQPISTRLLRE